MSYELSFSESFFTGEEETQITDQPTSILEAIENLDRGTKINIARDVLHVSDHMLDLVVDSEAFAHDVLDKVRETNTCSNLNPPVRVWIDPDGDYTVEVYDN